MRRLPCLILWSVLVALANPGRLAAEEGSRWSDLDREFQNHIRPLLEQYCYACHAGKRTEADIDLSRFKTLGEIRQQTRLWEQVREILDSEQMPPPEAKQPDEPQRSRLQTWVRKYLTEEARVHAGDPGPVVLRRLTNAEYNYTIADLTGIESLDPTREFPVDGAAGEGFTNTGAGQAMSPAMIDKYLAAAKEVAEHVVLLPNGIRFSEHTSRQDQSNELLARIRTFYHRYTEDGGGSAVNLQGIQFETNQGGRLPLERYLAATLHERQTISSGAKTLATVANERGLSPRYLTTLWNVLTNDTPESSSIWLNNLRTKWRSAGPGDAPKLAAEISAWQAAFWKFNSVGHIGRPNGPKAWLEPVSPITSQQQFRHKLPSTSAGEETVIYLAAGDLGDGNDHDFVIWENPRIEFPAEMSHPPIPLRDVRGLAQQIDKTFLAERRRTRLYLQAAATLRASAEPVEEAAKARGLNPKLLARWVELTALGRSTKHEIAGHFTGKLARVNGYEAVNGWGSDATPVLLTNSSPSPISFSTLTVPARGVTVHPSPKQEAIVAWQSPIDGRLRIEGLVADADDKCGNGAAWRVELHSDAGTTVAARGTIENGGRQRFAPADVFEIRQGDVISLVVNARDENHVCDTTHIELTLAEVGGQERTWNLAQEIVDRVLASNPLPDSYGHPAVWHFCATGGGSEKASPIPPGSSLANWRAAIIDGKPAGEVDPLAAAVERVLTTDEPSTLSEADQLLRATLSDWRGPLRWTEAASTTPVDQKTGFGLDPALFGKHPDGSSLDASSLCVQAPHVFEVRLPTALIAGGEFVASGVLDSKSGQEGSVQLQVLAEKPQQLSLISSAPVIAHKGSETRRRVEAAMEEFRNLFPAALCYTRIVPVDEVVTLKLYHREDEHLQRLMLDEPQRAELEKLWDELLFVSQEPLALTVAHEQLVEFATQDRPDLVEEFAPLRDPINRRAEEFRQRLVQTEPTHLAAVLEWADRAWRRPLSAAEKEGIRNLYRELRSAEIPHEKAIKLCIARVLTSPTFLYRREKPAPGAAPAPVSGLELATRLSYFLWSSLPDDELRRAAEEGKLTRDDELVTQTRRMLKHERTRRMAIQFACQWLHIRDFNQTVEKNENLYPEFTSLRDEMYEESVRFFEDMFRNNGSILGLLDADHTFLNAVLARHYGIEGIHGDEWRKVEGVKKQGRGGILGMATFLASQSGASRTSPILRGAWVSETLLGERLPRPPAGVPQLPDALPNGLSTRELIERHSSDKACARCHARIDPYGFALEQYDAIGRLRPQLADTRTTLLEGKTIEGLDGLREYLVNDRREDIVRQFCRKLLGYALGREVQLSDEPLLKEMQEKLAANEYRFHTAVEAIVLSRQFRNIRGESASQE